MRLSLPIGGPVWLDGLIFVIGGVLVFLGLIAAVGRVVQRPTLGPQNDELAGAKFAFLEPMLGVALFYALGEAALQRHAISTEVDIEIASLRSFAWTIDEIEIPATGPIHLAFDRYLLALVETEFPAMARGEETMAGFEALQGLAASLATAPGSAGGTTAARELRRQIRSISEHRERRLARALIRSPGLIIAIAASVTLLTFVFFLFLNADATVGRLLMAILLCAAILAVFFCVVVLYDMFADEWGSAPAALNDIRGRG